MRESFSISLNAQSEARNFITLEFISISRKIISQQKQSVEFIEKFQKCISAVVQRKQAMEFLHDIVPQKIKYKDYLKMMEDEQSDDDIF